MVISGKTGKSDLRQMLIGTSTNVHWRRRRSCENARIEPQPTCHNATVSFSPTSFWEQKCHSSRVFAAQH